MTSIETIHEMLLKNLIHKFASAPKDIVKRIKVIKNKDICSELLSDIFACKTIEEFKDILSKTKKSSGKSGLDYQQNYDVIAKWMGKQFIGKSLERFGIKTGKIVDVLSFEYTEIKVDRGGLDLILEDEGGERYRMEE